MKGKTWISSIYTGIVTNMSFLGAVWIVAIMLLIMCDVLGRNLWNQPIAGTAEIVKHSLVGITFFQIAHVLMEGRHIRSTVILERLSPKGRVGVEIVASVLGIIIFGLLFYAELGPTWKSIARGDYESDLLKIPTWPTHVIILIGSLLMVIQFGKTITDRIKSLHQKEQIVLNVKQEHKAPIDG